MNKRLIIFIILGIIILFFGLILGKTTRSLSTKPSPTPIPTKFAAPPPALTLINGAPTQVRFSFSGTDVQTPPSLMIYRFSPQTYTSDQLELVAQKLGFKTKQTRVSYGIKSNTSWTEQDKTLSYYTNGQDRIWSFTLLLSPPGTPQTVDLAVVAKNFLEGLFGSISPSSLFIKTRTSTQLDDFQTKDAIQPRLQGITFSSLIENRYPIVTYQFDQTTASCIIDEYGKIRFFSFSAPPQYTENGVKTIISPQDAINSLNKGLGLLIYAKSQGSSYLDSSPYFNSVLLTNYSMVYYPNPKTFILSPFYLFEGTATTTEGKVLEVKYAVSSLEKN